MNVKYILGADVGGTTVKYVLRTLEGIEILRGEIPTDISDSAATLGKLADRIRLDVPSPTLVAVGIACAGIVDLRNGRLGCTPNLPGWRGVNLKMIMAELWPGVLVVLANDVNGALVGEAREGAGRGYADIVMLALGTGVGGAVQIAGRVRVGARHGAGEIGHMVLDPRGPVCTCGNQGCLEAYAGAHALVEAARARTVTPQCGPALRAVVAGPEAPTSRILAELAGAGDADALDLFRRSGQKLGQAIGNLVNLLDPDLVIIGGGVSAAGDLLLDSARETAASLILGEESRKTPLVIAGLGSQAAAIGVAIIAGDTLADLSGSGS